jgi:hypothetical protein
MRRAGLQITIVAILATLIPTASAFANWSW